MSALASLQQRFLDTVLSGAAKAEADILGTPHFTIEQRLSVYANAYRRRLVEALASVFERCGRMLGEDAFDALALAYVETHPPHDRSLSRYGLDFPDWLRARDPRLATAAGVATIDAGLRRAFDAADAELVDREDLLALPVAAWARLRVAWVPALATGKVEAAAIARWREPEAPWDDAADRSITTIAFWRRDGQTFFRSMTAGEALLLERLRCGATLAEACTEGASPIPPEVAAPALLSWIDEGWVARLAAEDGIE
ncbi:MAG: hypothetical protein KatS3mg128_0433 [Silanimonas sp.]|nr:MAG: hypothetical protein KatS3mg128_0433 [Silanimonas sp.]